ncbi:MAG TPA: AraC family transcriptional regulator [Solirubrobacteraceae bacterium]|nr:AraC family transcriptional regulator [Solirubrobacteraceae bacterium]
MADRDLTSITRRRPRRPAERAPVYTYTRLPGRPAVSVARLVGSDWPVGVAGREDHAHAHDFLVLAYFDRGGGALRLDGRAWPVRTGDVFLIAPGEVVAVADPAGLAGARGWVVFFPAEVLEPRDPGALLSWRSHPLLFPFLGRAGGGVERLHVPARERRQWSRRLQALDGELSELREGHADAVLAHLTLLLVGVSRLAAEIGAELRLRDEPLLATVFEVIEARYPEPLSLAAVAAAVNLTPGHLTTVVRRKTGRTVNEWIAERRLSEARRLLSQTDLTVDAIARRVGYRHPSYFIKQFKHAHTVTPLAWRDQGQRGAL